MKNKIIKVLIISSFIFCAIFIMGCTENNSNTTLSMISNNMSKITNTLDKVQNIDNSTLFLSDFMDANDLTDIDIETINLLENTSMNAYITKLTMLNNNILATINLMIHLIIQKNKYMQKVLK